MSQIRVWTSVKLGQCYSSEIFSWCEWCNERNRNTKEFCPRDSEELNQAQRAGVLVCQHTHTALESLAGVCGLPLRSVEALTLMSHFIKALSARPHLLCQHTLLLPPFICHSSVLLASSLSHRLSLYLSLTHTCLFFPSHNWTSLQETGAVTEPQCKSHPLIC